ncbi:MAG: T9SS type A sorting domain-containing protein [Bacteroidota bacterium]
MEYDNNSDTLYGLFQDGATLNWYFAWIDYTNGFVHPKYSQQATTFGIGTTTYDKNHHRYFYSMGNTQYVLDAHTGQVIYSYVFPYYYYDLKYNNSDDKLYCISNPVNSLTYEFDTVEIATGILHTISNMPFHYSVGTPMLKAIDEINGRYFCVAGLTNTDWQLYTINIQNGSVIYSPFDTLLGNQHNLIELHYDNVLDTLYALYWGQNIELTIPEINGELPLINIYPNPSSGFITLTHNVTTKLEIEIHNIIGELIYKSTSKNQRITIDLSLKPKGIYFVKAFDGEKSYCKKLIVEHD